MLDVLPDAWAALSAAGLRHAPLPDGLDELVVAADFDGPGLVAAEQLKRRARAAGIRVCGAATTASAKLRTISQRGALPWIP